MPKQNKFITIYSDHHGYGDVYRYTFSNALGERKIYETRNMGDVATLEGNIAVKEVSEDARMRKGIVLTNLSAIINLLIQKVEAGQTRGFYKIVKRDFIYSSANCLTASWSSGDYYDRGRQGYKSVKHGKDILKECKVQPVFEVIHFSEACKKQTLFSAIAQSEQKEAFLNIMNQCLVKSASRLSEYIIQRSSQPEYTGWQFGYSKAKKIEAAKLLNKYWLGHVDKLTFFSADNKENRKVMQQGKLGVIAKDLIHSSLGLK